MATTKREFLKMSGAAGIAAAAARTSFAERRSRRALSDMTAGAVPVSVDELFRLRWGLYELRLRRRGERPERAA